MAVNAKALVRQVKAQGQDYEFYPTTDEIIKKFIRDMFPKTSRGHYTGLGGISALLDIGAGTGKVLKAVRDDIDDRENMVRPDLLAIEKSAVLYQELTRVCPVIGSDFLQQSLLGKRIDAIFCNPPYSEYETWAAKIITEAEAKYAWLVIPQRWDKSQKIAYAIDRREVQTEIIGSFDFLNAEDRKARARVDLVRVTFPRALRHDVDENDAFSRFFDDQFGHLKERYKASRRETLSARMAVEDEQQEKEKAPGDKLVKGANLVERMVEFYQADMSHAQHNYDLASQLDVDLLRELQVSPTDILANLLIRLQGLRGEYWTELFGNLVEVTDRLCSRQRKRMLDQVKVSGLVDFTSENAYAIVCWLLNHANEYMEEQLLETFDQMHSKANVRAYKSNKKVFTDDRWRYKEDLPTHVALEFRLVLDRMGGIRKDPYGGSGSALTDTACDFLMDLMTVGNNLGFRRSDDLLRFTYNARQDWISGRKEVFMCREVSGKRVPLFEVKGFYNGNIHVRLGQSFALALNVEVGRLRGWLKTPAEAVEELGDAKAAKCFGSHLRLGMASMKMLVAPPEAQTTLQSDQADLAL